MIGPSETPGIGPTVWGSDGGQWQAISQKHSWMQLKGTSEDKVDWPALTMQGQTVFRWAVWEMAPVAQQAIEKAGISAEDLAAFIPHQANMRIIDAMVKALKLPGRRRRRARHRDDRQHLRRLDPAGHGPDARGAARLRAAASPC